jgi:predicted permease
MAIGETITRFLRRLLARVRATGRASRLDADLRDELRSHLQMEFDANLRAGVPPGEARRRARLKLGNATAMVDEIRDRRGLPAIDLLLHDLRLALRTLAGAPGFALSTIGVLAIGISASTGAMTVFDAIAWQPLSVPNPGAVVKVAVSFDGDFDRKVAGHATYLSYPEYEAYASAARALSGLAATRTETVNLEQRGSVMTTAAALVTGNYFNVLGARAAHGRLLSIADDRQPVAVLGHRAWRRHFGADPAVVGQSMLIDRRDYTIVGVAEASFTGIDVAAPEVWVPLEAFVTAAGRSDWLRDENRGWLKLVGRLSDGVRLDDARSEARVVASRLDLSHPGRRTTLHVIRASRLPGGLSAAMSSPSATRPSDRARLGLGISLAALAGFVLLSICASNAAGLLLARGLTRQREIAVRVALGATRRRIVRQLLTESALIALAAGGLGLALSTWALRAMAHVLPMSEVLEHLTPGTNALVFTLVVSAVTTLLFGLLPARAATSVDVLSALKADGPGVSQARSAVRLRNGILVGQVTVTVVLLVAAALLTRSILRTMAFDAGFDARQTFTVGLDLARQGYDGVRQQVFVDSLVERLGRTPDVTAIAFTAAPPFGGRGLTFAGVQPDALRQSQFNICDRRYFDVLGLRLSAGRLFADGDTHAVAVVNEAFARELWPGEPSPIGRRFFVQAEGGPRSAEVIGIVRVAQTVAVGIDDDPTFYQPADRTGTAGLTMVIAGRGNVGDTIRQSVREIDPRLIVAVGSIAERIQGEMGSIRVGAAAAGLVGLLALLIATVGIHGIVAYSVARRTREIGVHLALGARAADVMRLVLTSTLKPVAVGAIAGTVIAAAGAMLFWPQGMAASDVVAFVAPLAVLAVAAAAAGLLPARRALAIGPMTALRRE